LSNVPVCSTTHHCHSSSFLYVWPLRRSWSSRNYVMLICPAQLALRVQTYNKEWSGQKASHAAQQAHSHCLGNQSLTKFHPPHLEIAACSLQLSCACNHFVPPLCGLLTKTTFAVVGVLILMFDYPAHKQFKDFPKSLKED